VAPVWIFAARLQKPGTYIKIHVNFGSHYTEASECYAPN